jgi:hypothetical protein
VNARDSRFILVLALDRDRVIVFTSSQRYPLRWIDCYVVLFITWVSIVSLYINREDYGATTILVGSKEGILI